MWREGKRGLRSPFHKTLSLLPPMPPGSPSLRGDASEAAEVALGNGHGQVRVPGPLVTGEREGLPSRGLALHCIAGCGVTWPFSRGTLGRADCRAPSEEDERRESTN